MIQRMEEAAQPAAGEDVRVPDEGSRALEHAAGHGPGQRAHAGEKRAHDGEVHAREPAPAPGRAAQQPRQLVGPVLGALRLRARLLRLSVREQPVHGNAQLRREGRELGELRLGLAGFPNLKR